MNQQTYFATLNAVEDLTNRYLSTVIVTDGPFPPYKSFCSGILVHPRLVITAGHCVCLPRHPSQHINDSDCLEKAYVTGYFYRERGDNSYDKCPLPVYQGIVRPHEKFAADIGDQMQVMESTTDLAAIVLDQPMEGVRPDVEFPSQEVKIKDTLMTVGFGYNHLPNGSLGRRYAGSNIVTGVYLSSLSESDDSDVVFLFSKPGAHAAPGDSGGPCFRMSPKGSPALVGIVSRYSGNGSASLFTSVYPHLKWIRELIEEAD